MRKLRKILKTFINRFINLKFEPMSYDKVKVRVYLYDSSTEDEIEVDEPILLDYDENDMDIEIELVHGTGGPGTRPKQPPRI